MDRIRKSASSNRPAPRVSTSSAVTIGTTTTCSSHGSTTPSPSASHRTMSYQLPEIRSISPIYYMPQSQSHSHSLYQQGGGPSCESAASTSRLVQPTHSPQSHHLRTHSRSHSGGSGPSDTSAFTPPRPGAGARLPSRRPSLPSHSRPPSRELPPLPPLPSASWWQRLTGPSQPPAAVSRVVEAGFPRSTARKALAKANGDVDEAIELLREDVGTGTVHKDEDEEEDLAVKEVKEKKERLREVVGRAVKDRGKATANDKQKDNTKTAKHRTSTSRQRDNNATDEINNDTTNHDSNNEHTTKQSKAKSAPQHQHPHRSVSRRMTVSRWSFDTLKLSIRPPLRASSLSTVGEIAPRGAFEHVRRPGLEPIPEPWVLLEPEFEQDLLETVTPEVSPQRAHQISTAASSSTKLPRRVASLGHFGTVSPSASPPPMLVREPVSYSPGSHSWSSHHHNYYDDDYDDYNDDDDCSSFHSNDTFGVRGPSVPGGTTSAPPSVSAPSCSASGSTSICTPGSSHHDSDVVRVRDGSHPYLQGHGQNQYSCERSGSGVQVWVVEVARWPGDDAAAPKTAKQPIRKQSMPNLFTTAAPPRNAIPPPRPRTSSSSTRTGASANTSTSIWASASPLTTSASAITPGWSGGKGGNASYSAAGVYAGPGVHEGALDDALTDDAAGLDIDGVGFDFGSPRRHRHGESERDGAGNHDDLEDLFVPSSIVW